jgi:murein L,D-transpeptidase YafK
MKKIVWIVLIVIITIYYFYPEVKLPNDILIDKIVILKSEHRLEAYSRDKLVKKYNVSLGRSKGKKQFEGDNKTPEGVYFINDKNPHSSYYMNLGISYPNEEDTRNAQKQNLPPGNEIKIHGIRNGLGFIGKFHRLFDWTQGCIAVTNNEMKELYDHTMIGAKIEIRN